MAPEGSDAPGLARKIGVRPGDALHLHHAPGDWAVPDLPEGVTVVHGGPRGADITVSFHRSLTRLTAGAPVLAGELADPAMLWIAWPRRAAGHASDIREDDLRTVFLPLGLVDVKVAALGEDWSGLKFVRRTENRG